MKSILLSISILICSYSYSQSEEQLQAFGKEVFEALTDSSELKLPSYIRSSEYKKLIRTQPWPLKQQDISIHKMDEKYNHSYMMYQQSYSELRGDYQYDLKKNASFEFLESSTEPMENSEGFYHFKIKLLFKQGKVQSMIEIIFDAAWTGTHMAIISDLKEDF